VIGLTRRGFLSLALKGGAGFVAGYGFAQVNNPYGCRIRRASVTLAGLPAAFQGYRVALMSDFHHSSWIPVETIRSAVQLANSLQPDLIALTGDFVHNGRRWVGPCAQELGKLQAADGVVAVLGNHDHADKAAPLMRVALRKYSIADLTNCGIGIRRYGEELWVGGVGDLWRERQKIRSAMAGAMIRQSSILLSHNPDYAEELLDERVGLMLSGHTHGGQCVLPIIGAPILPSKYGQKYRSGLCQGPTTQVFVTTGVGSSFPPVRFNCPPEVALLTLQKGAV
jgi:predicted MPP superfamily phosphohydrolase